MVGVVLMSIALWGLSLPAQRRMGTAAVCSGTGKVKVRPWDGLERGDIPPLQGDQPMPSHCLPDGKRQLQWHSPVPRG